MALCRTSGVVRLTSIRVLDVVFARDKRPAVDTVTRRRHKTVNRLRWNMVLHCRSGETDFGATSRMWHHHVTAPCIERLCGAKFPWGGET